MAKSKIHIKPQNRGKFTAAAKRAGMSVQEFARHVLANPDKYSPLMRRRANFARNAAKWKYDGGGPLNYNYNYSSPFLDNNLLNKHYVDVGLPLLNLSPIPSSIFGTPANLDTGLDSSPKPLDIKTPLATPIDTTKLHEMSYYPVNSLEDSVDDRGKEYTPMLSPLGHILSSVADLVTYNKLKKTPPLPVSLPRVGAQRISLAGQRLANIRNADLSRRSATTIARALGRQGGDAYTGAIAARSGVDRLLAQLNAELAEKEEMQNAQLRQQADAINAELGAQEALFNTQQANAYRTLLASNSPLSILARNAASYIKDNAAKGYDYTIARLYAPQAHFERRASSNPFIRNLLDDLLGRPPVVRYYD